MIMSGRQVLLAATPRVSLCSSSVPGAVCSLPDNPFHGPRCKTRNRNPAGERFRRLCSWDDQAQPGRRFVRPNRGLARRAGGSALLDMIGDFFGSGGRFVLTIGASACHRNDDRVCRRCPGAAVPRFKMAELTSPIPEDRVFFDYDNYHDAPANTTANPNIAVNCYTPGFEKTFLGGVASVELRLPMATTLDNNVYFDGATSRSEGEVGDLSLTVKAFVFRRETLSLTAGLAMTVPTAKDSQGLFLGNRIQVHS